MSDETATDTVAVARITAVVGIAAAGIAAAGTVAAGTAVIGSMTLGNGGTGWGGCYHPEHCDPFVDNTLDAKPTTSSSFPSFVCGYQNRACFGIL